MTDSTPPRHWGGTALSIGLVALFAFLCGRPYLHWLEHPSLYHDDFMRVESLRNSTLGASLFRPFNEHMAPLFETVSYLSWLASGRQIQALPMAFMVASFLAFAATVGMLGALIRRETGSRSASMVAVALFSLSSVSAETVLWYSASSFQWAAAATLTAWYCSASSVESTSPRIRRLWLFGTALTSLAAPAFSAIGILAAPLASLRLLAGRSETLPTRRELGRAMVPAMGLGLYLLICAGFRYREVLSDSLSRNLDLGAAVSATVRAPAWVLLPSLIGLPDQSLTMPGWIAALMTILAVLGCLVACWKRERRSLILGGLALVAGGYLLTYAARARPGDLWIIKISRYHLFPQIGLICVIIALLGGLFRRLDRRPVRGLLAVVLLVTLFAPLQYRGMRLAAEGSFRFPDQLRLFATAARLEEVASVESITFLQLFYAIDPVQPRWAPHPWPFHPILFLFQRGRTEARLPDPKVRDAVIAALSPADREVLFGGMEATKYLRPLTPGESSEPDCRARLVATSRVKPIGGDQYEVRDGMSYLEYQLDPVADEARLLCLPGLKADWPVEVWWASGTEEWSAGRSVRWKPDLQSPQPDEAVPLGALPHWRRGAARRLRIIPGGPGTIAVGAPRFLR